MKFSPRYLIPFLSFLPTLIFVIYWSQSYPASQNALDLTDQRRTPFKALVIAYFATAVVGIIILGIVQSLIGFLLSVLVFGTKWKEYMTEMYKQAHEITEPEHVAKRAKMAASWRYWVFLAAFAFLVAGIFEEAFKYGGLLFTRRYSGTGAFQEHDYLFVIAAAALGLSTMENLGFIYGLQMVTRESGKRLALMVFERLFFGTLMHGLCSLLVGISSMRKYARGEDINIAVILGLPILFHGVFDFLVVAGSAYDGHVGFVHPEIRSRTFAVVAVGALTIVGALATAVAIEMKNHGPIA